MKNITDYCNEALVNEAAKPKFTVNNWSFTSDEKDNVTISGNTAEDIKSKVFIAFYSPSKKTLNVETKDKIVASTTEISKPAFVKLFNDAKVSAPDDKLIDSLLKRIKH